MNIRELDSADFDAAVDLWDSAGLTRPWNPPREDLQRALEGPTSTVLGGFDDNEAVDADLLGTVMTGHDGHRGWVYYLAVADSHRGEGLGRQLMDAAEHWLRARGAVKVHLMVRSTNESVTAFYQRLGYEDAAVKVLAKRLN